MEPTSIEEALQTMSWEPPRQPCDMHVQVTGENDHIDAIQRVFDTQLKGQRVKRITRSGRQLDDLACVLVPEWWRGCDSEAIAVVIGTSHVGYLDARHATLYFGALKRLAIEHNVLACGKATLWAQERPDGRFTARVSLMLPSSEAFEGAVDRKADESLEGLVPFGQTDSDWIRFESDLADTLQGLEEDEFLVVSAKQANQFVQFACQGRFGMRAEAASNAYIAGPQGLLTPEDQALMAQLGWSAPTGSAEEEAAHELGPDGSPNFFVDEQEPLDFDEVARRAVRTFRRVYRIDHPGLLQYQALHPGRSRDPFPGAPDQARECSVVVAGGIAAPALERPSSATLSCPRLTNRRWVDDVGAWHAPSSPPKPSKFGECGRRPMESARR